MSRREDEDRRSRGYRGDRDDSKRERDRELSREADFPQRPSSRTGERDPQRDRDYDDRDRRDKRDDSRGRRDRSGLPPAPRPLGGSTSGRNTPPQKERGDGRGDDRGTPGSGPSKRGITPGQGNSFLAEVLKHSKQVYGSKVGDGGGGDDGEDGEIVGDLDDSRKRKHSPIHWDPETKMPRTQPAPSLYERTLMEAAQLKALQAEYDADAPAAMKSSPSYSGSGRDSPQRDASAHGEDAVEDVPRARASRWLDVAEEDKGPVPGPRRLPAGSASPQGAGEGSMGLGMEAGAERPGGLRSSDNDDFTSDDEDEGAGARAPVATTFIRYDMRRECRNVDEYEKVDKISEGTYGVVYRAREKSSGRIVALKRIKMEKERDGFPITSVREINILLNFHHPNIVNVEEVVISARNPDHIFMVMEYSDHDLKSLMEDKSMFSRPFSVAEAKCLMRQLLEGVAFLHHHWVLHRDLKTSNILYNSRGELKICDFGMARQYGDPLVPYTHLVVTLWYRAPELLMGQTLYSTAVDVWSVGAIMGEILTGKPLFPGQGELDQMDQIVRLLGTPTEAEWPGLKKLPNYAKVQLRNTPPQLRSKFTGQAFGAGTTLTEAGYDLLSSLLAWDPEARLSAKDALEHRWFSEPPLPQKKELMPLFAPRKANR